jgi:hypothetical protein
MLKPLFLLLIISLLSCKFIFARDSNVFIEQDQNVSSSKEVIESAKFDIPEKTSKEIEKDSEVTRKVKNFFGGFVDDIVEFAVDNKLMKSTK